MRSLKSGPYLHCLPLIWQLSDTSGGSPVDLNLRLIMLIILINTVNF